jgi:hypothetical protein
MNKKTGLVLVGFFILACGVKEKPDEVSGVYVHEYSFEIVNPESGAKIGLRTVRDSIFIKAIEVGYEVANKKWRKNDYDLEGWQNMEHSDDRPMPLFRASFDLNKLSNSDLSFVFYLDPNNEQLTREKGGTTVYYKVK